MIEELARTSAARFLAFHVNNVLASTTRWEGIQNKYNCVPMIPMTCDYIRINRNGTGSSWVRWSGRGAHYHLEDDKLNSKSGCTNCSYRDINVVSLSAIYVCYCK